MAKREPNKLKTRKSKPATSIEARENQLISLAMDLAEQRMRDGTASAQEVTHFLKLGSTKERLERSMMEEQKKLLVAKTENLESQKRTEEAYREAMKAFATYSGKATEVDEDYED